MVVEDEQPILTVPSPSSSPELQGGKLCNGSHSPEIKVVPLSELSNLFVNTRARNDSKSEDERKYESSDCGDASPSPQPLKDCSAEGDDVICSGNDSAGRDSNDTADLPVDQEHKRVNSHEDSGGK